MTVKSGSLGRSLLLAALSFLFLLPSSFAQTGSFAGTVIDGDFGDPLIGANVVLKGTLQGTSTDLEGRFRIDGIPVGTHMFEVSYIGFQTLTIQNVEILDGEVTRLDVTLESEAFELEGEVVVEARAIRNNESVLLKDRQKADAVSDAISAEAISRSGSGDAASAMSKVTGASVMGGKYVYIRGLGDRYTNTTLNGSSLPSADPDRKAFQLDLFPTALLDNIVSLKTFTPDRPGDFSGGLVDVSTKAFPDNFTFSLSASLTYDDLATGSSDFLTYARSSTDWIGWDDGQRSLPDLFSDKDPDARSVTEQDMRDLRSGVTNEIRTARADSLNAFAKAFNGQMVPVQVSAPINHSFSTAIGGQSKLKGMTIGYTGSVTYGRTYSLYDDGVFSQWNLTGGTVEGVDNLVSNTYFGADPDLNLISRADPLEAASFINMRGSEEANWGTSGSFSIKPSSKHEMTLTALRTQSGRSEATLLGGFRDQNATSAFLTRALDYKERSLTSMQLRGKSLLGPVTAEWAVSGGQNTQEEPDLRFFSSVQNIFENAAGVDTTFSLGGGNAPPPQRFFRDLVEDTRNAKLDLMIPVSIGANRDIEFKVGGAIEATERSFRQRRFEYREGREINFRDFDGDIAAYLAPENFGVLDTLNIGDIVAYNAGIYIQENSPKRGNYDANRDVQAAYAMVKVPVTRSFNAIIGARLETTTIMTESFDDDLPDELRLAELDETDVLPSINVVYELTNRMNLRAAATRTLARPTFRELAPFQSFDFVGGDVQEGNPLLERTLITNYDLRWEWFVRPGEIFAVSGFYKDFQNPIERVFRVVGEGRFVGFQNVESATVYGAEFEARKRLDTITSNAILSRISLGGNFSIVRSEVDIPDEEMTIILSSDPNGDSTRQLVGQSPFLLNLNAVYENIESGTAIGLYYTIFGDRLLAVTEGATPDIFEEARADLDLTISKKVSQDFRMKLSAKNMLGTDMRQIQSFKGTDYEYLSYSRSRTFSMGLTYEIN
ncbi:MAG: TonB-dependent receptor [Bacteroidetes bacterium]|nr:TonB-dependent receptor [Bacteroidota bacterium]